MDSTFDAVEKQRLYKRARKLGIHFTSNTSKLSLIRSIQRKEGHFPCFCTDERDYCIGGCEWEAECKNMLVAAWKR